MFDEQHVIYRYKYLPFSEGSLKTLTEGTIKFTCPLEFNDPFDCFPYYDPESVEQIPHTRPDLFKAAGDRQGLSPAKRLQKKGRIIAELRNRMMDRSFVADLLRDVGVVSLSTNALNILMWSHYADFHRGLVLEFRIPTLGTSNDLQLSRDRLLPLPVHYERDRPHVRIGVEDPNVLVQKVLLTKSKDWEYQQEERVIDQERGPGIYGYSRDEVLCSVVAGMRMSDENYQRLRAMVSDLAQHSIPNLKLFRAQSKDAEYKLEVENHPRLTSTRFRGNTPC